MQHQTEVAIVGKGIAASVLSLLLKQRGVSHLVLDRQGQKEGFPLGETLPPSALGMLEQLGLRDLFAEAALGPTYGYHSIWGSARRTDQHFFQQNPIKEGLKLDRSRLQQQLLAAGQAPLLAFDHLQNLEATERGWRLDLKVKDKFHKVDCSIVVDATGRNRALLKRLDIGQQAIDQLVAFSCHLPQTKPWPLIHGVLVESFPTGWGIVSRLDDATNVVTLYTLGGHPEARKFRRYEEWQNILAETSILKDFLTEAEPKIVGGDANSSRVLQAAGANWFAVGDAAMAYDPLSSHGISTAVYGAARAAEAIVATLAGDLDAPAAYDQLLKGIFATYLQEKTDLYRQETRWPESPFWVQQHSIEIPQLTQ